MGTGKRILATVVTGLALVGGGLKVMANEAASGANEVIAASKVVPRPVKHEINKALGHMAKQEAKDLIWASCQLKDSSNIEQQARWDYWNRGEYKIGLIVSLAKAMQADPEVGALCSQIS